MLIVHLERLASDPAAPVPPLGQAIGSSRATVPVPVQSCGSKDVLTRSTHALERAHRTRVRKHRCRLRTASTTRALDTARRDTNTRQNANANTRQNANAFSQVQTVPCPYPRQHSVPRVLSKPLAPSPSGPSAPERSRRRHGPEDGDRGLCSGAFLGAEVCETLVLWRFEGEQRAESTRAAVLRAPTECSVQHRAGGMAVQTARASWALLPSGGRDNAGFSGCMMQHDRQTR